MIVTGIGVYLGNHWHGPTLDWQRIKITGLVHDLGNVVKFDLDKHPEYLGKEQTRVEYWKQVQKQVIEKYGADDHEATKRMLTEIGIGQEMQATILDKSFGNSIKIAAGRDWYAKILAYCDMRVLPGGIGTLDERLQDVRERMPKYANRPDFEELLAANRAIEKEIQENSDVPVSQISDETVSVDEKLLDFDIV